MGEDNSARSQLCRCPTCVPCNIERKKSPLPNWLGRGLFYITGNHGSPGTIAGLAGQANRDIGGGATPLDA